MTIERALTSAQSSIPECIAVGYVDMSSGMLLGFRTVDSHPSEVLDLLSAATADLFQGPNVVAIEKMFKRARGTENDSTHYFNEIIVNSTNLLHVFLRSKKNPDHALGVVCRASANIGMVLTKARMAMPDVEGAV